MTLSIINRILQVLIWITVKVRDCLFSPNTRTYIHARVHAQTHARTQKHPVGLDHVPHCFGTISELFGSVSAVIGIK